MVGDWLGRTMPSFPRLIFFSTITNRIVVAIRFIFIPLFIFCVNPHLMPYWDALPCIFMFIFALSNGYTSSMKNNHFFISIHSSTYDDVCTARCQRSRKRNCRHNDGITSVLLLSDLNYIQSFCLNVGIFFGTNIALGFLKIVDPSASIL